MEKITPNELRMGNWIQHSNGEIYQATEYTQLIIMRDGKDFMPVPITEDWLLKFGFELEYKSPFTIRYTMEDASIGYDWSKMTGWSFRYFGHRLKCEYVHQLQNLVFALKGTELVLSGSAKV